MTHSVASSLAPQKVEAMLLGALPWLLRQQMPTGELFCRHRPPGRDATPYPYPLFSALASEALACLDPRSPFFSPQLHDILPARRRRECTQAVVTLRWQIRCYLAAEQDAGGVWRVHGRTGNSAPDLATTVCAATLLLEDRIDAPISHMEAIRVLMAEHPDDILGQVFGLRLLSIAAEELPEAIATETEDPLPVAWAIDQVERQGHIPFPVAPRPPLAFDPHPGRLRMAFGVSSALRRPAATDGLQRAIDALANDPLPPWLWPDDPLRDFVSSPAATLAIQLHTIAQVLAAEHEGTLPC